MRRTIEILTALLLSAAFTFLTMCIWFAFHIAPTVETTLRDLHTTVLEAGLTLKNIREATQEWKNASAAQAENSTKSLEAFSSSAKRLELFIAHTDKSLGETLASTNLLIEHQDSALLTTQKDLQANLTSMLQATQQLQKDLSDADLIIADPAIKKSLDNLAKATEDAAEATHHLSNITADGEKTADYYAKRLTTPQSFLKTVAEAILQLGSQARILFNK